MVNMTTRPTRLTERKKHLYSKDMNQNNQSTNLGYLCGVKFICFEKYSMRYPLSYTV